MSKEERRMTQEEKAAAQDQKNKAREGGDWKQRWSQKVNYKNYRYSYAWEGCWY